MKMLALGADAVLLGRPITQAGAGGEEGIEFLLNYLASELAAAMIMTGVSDLGAVSSEIIYKP